MRSALIILILSTALNAGAQSFAPVGAKWTFGIYEFWVGEYPSTWTSVQDTVILGKSCTIVKCDHFNVGDQSTEFICYEENGIVSWYNPMHMSFTTFIDFNSDSGDSWTTAYPYPKFDTCAIKVFVDSVDSIAYNGHKLKRLYVHLIDSMGPAFAIVERLGFTESYGPGLADKHGLYPGKFLQWHCEGSMSFDGPEYAGLRCYEDSVVGFIDFEPDRECDFTSNVGVKKVDSDFSVKTVPNPVHRYLEIQIKMNDGPVLGYSILGTMGNEVLSGSLNGNTTLDVSSLPNGVYLLKLISNRHTGTSRFVKN